MDWQEDPERGAEFVIGAVEHPGIAVEGDGALEFADAGGAEGAEFAGEHGFEAGECFGYKLLHWGKGRGRKSEKGQGEFMLVDVY